MKTFRQFRVLHEAVYAETPFVPYKRKNPTLRGKKRTTTRGLVDNSKMGSHVIRSAAVESPKSKGHFNYSVTVNGRRKPDMDKKNRAHQAVHARHAISRLSEFLKSHNPASVKIANMHMGDAKQTAHAVKILGLKHGYEIRTNKSGKGVISHSFHRKHSW
jgi:hypothetical protein